MRFAQIVPPMCLLGLLALTLPGEAQAQSSSPPKGAAQTKAQGQPKLQRAPSDAMSDKARKLYIEGVMASEKDRWADAYASFVAAWALQKHYTIAGGMGTCELMLQKYRDAAEHLAIYVREIEKDATTTPEERAAAVETYAKARAKVGAVVVGVNVQGADVLVDGARVGTAPLADPVFVEPGAHTITVKREGYVPSEKKVEVGAGSEARSDFELARPVASAPLRPVAEPARAEGTGTKANMGIVVAGGSVAAAGVIAGVVFTLVADKKASDKRKQWHVVHAIDDGTVDCAGPVTDNAAQQCEKLRSLVKGRDFFSNLAVWSYAVGGAAAIGTLGYTLFATSSGEPEPERRQMHLSPLMMPGGGGIVAGGAF
ncbi:PEGA domain-containing protein [Sorangium sp. So ce1182]|uniref:PEGA domain-containing protein n=1 Tax=Sorangium sp. So ce1182 TaxID=3133334 RepID=UPI003F640F9C